MTGFSEKGSWAWVGGEKFHLSQAGHQVQSCLKAPPPWSQLFLNLVLTLGPGPKSFPGPITEGFDPSGTMRGLAWAVGVLGVG